MSVESRLEFVARNRVLATLAVIAILATPGVAGACMSFCDQPMGMQHTATMGATAHHNASHALQPALKNPACCTPESSRGKLCSPQQSTASFSFVPVTNFETNAAAPSHALQFADRVITTSPTTTALGSPPLLTRTISVLRI